MSVLNKLLNMLDELKEENPELANKALLAAETLKAGATAEDLEEEIGEEEWEEEFDDSYVVISGEDTRRFFDGSASLDKKLGEYGLYMRDHEVQKQLMLEEIENIREGNEKLLQELRDRYSLDPSSAYGLELDDEGSGNLAFVKR